MNLVDQIDGEIAPGYPGLIGYDDNKVIMPIQQPDGLRHSRKDHKPAWVVDVTHLLIDGPITIDEYGRLFQNISPFVA